VSAAGSQGPTILLVDDNPTNLRVLYQTLDGQGYHLLAARSGKDGVAIARRTAPDLILLDVMMPEMDGFETCTRLKADPLTRGAAVIFLSALTDPGDKVRGLELGAVDFVNKPFQAEEVLARVRTHLTILDLQKQLRRRNAELEHELNVAQELLREARARSEGVLLGESPVAMRVRAEIQKAAAGDDTLVISGPQGSDHEAVARAVHHQSRRAARAFICLSCLSVADASASHRTGDAADITGKLRLAHGGTLYLEGIQYLPRQSQTILESHLAALAHGSEAHGGAGHPASAGHPFKGAEADVRLIVSTTRDLDDEVARGRLIPELHRRLRATIDLAPLRARLEDLSILVPFILRHQAEQAGRTPPLISDESMNRMKAYRWPGNLRELRNVLGAALAVSSGAVLEVGEHLLDNGVRVGSYSLIEPIGSGGMGEVWLARHHLLARPAAVKIVHERAVGTGEDAQALRERFAREAQVTAELQCPHTVQLFDFGITDAGSFYYVMERLRGMDLQRMVERHGPLPPERAIFLLRQACLSLSEAHGLGLVHRDIKPGNLFVCRLGQQCDFLKVLDFGVVSRRGGDAARPITVSGLVLGTPAFLAPELVAQSSFDARADIYSLGCVAFWLLAGRPPFVGTDVMELLKQHVDATPLPPSALAPDPIPQDLDALVMECLAKDPAHRPATAEQLVTRLDSLSVAQWWSQQRARAWWTLHEPELLDHA
jgi:DNA-binding NtrC family response regulator